VLTLKLFGAASIETSSGPIAGRAGQGRRLALLALLSLARGRAVTRDKVIALLWPESTTDRARQKLSDDLYILRSALGDEVIRSSGDELALNPDAVASDVATFERLLDQGRLEAAVDLVAGPLLDGFHVPDAAELDRWLDSERTRIEHRYAAALESLAEASESRGEPAAAAQAVQWWRKLAVRDPANGRVAMRLMRALDAAGDRAGALRHARVHGALPREEYDAEPDADVTAFAEQLRVESRSRPAPDAVSARPATLPPTRNVDASPETESNLRSVTDSSSVVPERRRWLRGLVYGAGAALLVALTVLTMRGFAALRPAARPSASSVGVMPFVNMSPEPGDAYLGDGLTEQIITTLSRIAGLRVAARTSSCALRNGNRDVRAIGDT
jgi:DNA-binding SARP family transcriptional activator